MKSPLRYPGGKTRAIPILKEYMQREYPSRRQLLSPFLGGGSFELSCLELGYTVFANDLFRPLYVFWSILKDNHQQLQNVVSSSLPVTKEAFSKLRTTIMSLDCALEIAASYFIVNRCSFSGATFCGGFSQEASEKRLTASSIERLGKVNLSNMTLSNLDAIEFLKQHPETDDTVIYADPPYYISTYIYGKDGDMHEGFDHKGFADYIRTRKDWILSYNDCEYIRELYSGCRVQTEKWAYGMNASKPSTEIIILPPL
jgi:DNA adenine methylase